MSLVRKKSIKQDGQESLQSLTKYNGGWVGKKGGKKGLSSNVDLDFIGGQLLTPAEMKPSILFAKDNKNSGLQRPWKILLPYLRNSDSGLLPPLTLPYLTQFHSPWGQQQIAHHHPRDRYAKAEDRNLDDSYRDGKEEEVRRPCLLGLSCTLVVSLSFVRWLCACDTFK